jgi:ElaB/YqjD/DUF883 family membrane-anchored ribosome-binding protein
MSSKAAMDQLVSDAEELLAKLKDAGNPEIQKLRAKVESGIAEAKGAIAGAKESATEQVQLSVERLRQLSDSVVGYVQENPWVAVAAGTAIAVALIFVAFSGRNADE